MHLTTFVVVTVLAHMSARSSGSELECCGSALGGVCDDFSQGTPCCGVGSCNVFCCDCDGGCRKPPSPPPPVPSPSPDQLRTPLNQWPMIITHDAATGYFKHGTCNKERQVNDWAETQPKGTFASQLDCGARALDLRMYVEDGVLKMHHASIEVAEEFSTALTHVMSWTAAHPQELVVLYPSHCDGKSDSDKAQCNQKTNEAFSNAGIKMLNCNQLAHMTLGDALSQGKIPNKGSVIGTMCVEENYDSSIKCYGKASSAKDCFQGNLTQVKGKQLCGEEHYTCYGDDADKAFAGLWSYMTQLSNTAEAPHASDGKLWMLQAHWQYDKNSIEQGVLHGSCILGDENKAGVNSKLVTKIRNRELKHINLLEVDNVCDHGLDLLAALRGVAQQDMYVV